VKTLFLTQNDIPKAAAILRAGGLVAFPTETVYGLGADALSETAVRKIYAAKGRPSDNPSIVHVADTSDLEKLTDFVSPAVQKLAETFWPGPLTIIVPKSACVPAVVTGGLSTVAVRLPANEIARALIRQAGTPIAAPSANLSGKPSPTAAAHVHEDFCGKIDAIIDGGNCSVGIESTIIDMSGAVPEILRPGAISAAEIARVLGCEVKDFAAKNSSQSEDAPPRAPGMKYRHYAPKAEMLIVYGERAKVERKITELKKENEGKGKKVGILLFNEENYENAAKEFYARLRAFDKEGVDLILAGALTEDAALGSALMNRMAKAASDNFLRV